jgi:hypothetical protein
MVARLKKDSEVQKNKEVEELNHKWMERFADLENSFEVEMNKRLEYEVLQCGVI